MRKPRRPTAITERDLPYAPTRKRSPLLLTPAQGRRVREKLRALWLEHGTQSEAARVLGVRQQVVAGAFRSRVSIALAAVVSMHLGVLLADLIGPREDRRAT